MSRHQSLTETNIRNPKTVPGNRDNVIEWLGTQAN